MWSRTYSPEEELTLLFGNFADKLKLFLWTSNKDLMRDLYKDLHNQITHPLTDEELPIRLIKDLWAAALRKTEISEEIVELIITDIIDNQDLPGKEVVSLLINNHYTPSGELIRLVKYLKSTLLVANSHKGYDNRWKVYAIVTLLNVCITSSRLSEEEKKDIKENYCSILNPFFFIDHDY